MKDGISRRRVLAAAATAPAAGLARAGDVLPGLIERHDRAVERILRDQVTDPSSPHCGGYPDEFGIYFAGSAASVLQTCAAAMLHPGSKFHRNRLMAERMRLAAGLLERSQSPQGNISLPITNFNSPPDTAFVVHGVATAAAIARRNGARELAALMEPFLRRAGAGMASGGVHTPNHRWVVCSALAQVNDLFPDPAYVRRIDQWLAEGVDMDEDGQYTERSTTVYNPHCDRAFIIMAEKLKRPELLDYPRRNLQAMLFLMHPGYEVVTEISRRQDLNLRGDMGPYWFSLRYFAVREGDGRFAAIENRFAATHASLATFMEYPELAAPTAAPVEPPDSYEKHLRSVGAVRIRRGPVSATLLYNGNNHFFTFRRGEAVVNAVRFASAFFGKGQFVPRTAAKRGDAWWAGQDLTAGYYQPLDPARKVGPGDWQAARPDRRQTEICRMRQEAWVTEVKDGFRVRLMAAGTAEVPLAVEIGLREGGKLEGCQPAPKVPDGWVLPSGYALYRGGADAIRFGPGAAPHRWTQIRGAHPKIEGPGVYITGYTPFDHTLSFTWA